jgi:hypothetical protein
MRGLLLFCLFYSSACASDPFWTSFQITAYQVSPEPTVTAVTVPEHKTLYLTNVTANNLSLDAPTPHTSFLINTTTFLAGTDSYSWQDGYMPIYAGQSLNVHEAHGSGGSGETAFVTITGYYETECPPMDFNGDCKVDFADFAIFAQHWLEGY